MGLSQAARHIQHRTGLGAIWSALRLRGRPRWLQGPCDLARSNSGLIRQCADGMAVSLRSGSPPLAFATAGRFRALPLKLARCEVVLIGGRLGASAQEEVRQLVAGVSAECGRFCTCEAGKNLGLYLGLAALSQSWSGPLEQWGARSRELAHRGVPATALTQLYRQRAFAVLVFVGPLIEAPGGVAEM